MNMIDEEYREKRRKICRESQKRRRDAARKQCICIICCQRPMRPGRKTCTVCAEYYGMIAHKRYLERKEKVQE